MNQHRIRPDAGWLNGPVAKGPNGRGLCRLCGVEVPKGCRTFCSAACVHEWKIQSDPAYVRRQVFRRDRGVCAECGLDTEALRREVNDPKVNDFINRTYRPAALRERLVALGFKATAYQRGEFWQADHLLPVVEGGGCCGLEGYRTLCTPCHKRATKELAGRLAAKRRAEREAATQPLFVSETTELAS